MRVMMLAGIFLLAYTGAAQAASIREQVQRKFGDNSASALCVAQAESEMKPWAVSRTHDYGLMQIHTTGGGRLVEWWEGGVRKRRWFSQRELLTVAGNLEAAYIISDKGRSWRAWAPRTRRLCNV